MVGWESRRAPKDDFETPALFEHATKHMVAGKEKPVKERRGRERVL